MAQIPEHIVRSVREAADILEVVGDFVSLKKKGSNWWACCPFHDEKSPSFSVSASKGIYKCFGCGKAGDSVKFVMEHEGLSYPDALRFLGGKFGIEIREEQLTEEQQRAHTMRESVIAVTRFARDRYVSLMQNEPEGRAAGLAYFRERGFTDETIEVFELGYSLDAWNDLEKAASAADYRPEMLEKAGLIIRKNDRTYDRFRGRVMFPIHDTAGNPIAFGARTLKKDDKPKYLNSPETLVYNKSEVLYGIFQAKNEIRKADNCFLCEGYTDVLSMHQEGIGNVVASSGTSLTEQQIRLIKRFTPNITVLYDGDPAGIKASLRGIDLILSEGMNVRAVVFPEGEDPDSYARKLKGPAFKTFLEEGAKDFITFKTELFLREAKNDPVRRAEAVREIVGSISKVPDAISRAVFFKQCAEMLEISEDILVSESNKLILEEKQRSERRASRAPADFPPADLPPDIYGDMLPEDPGGPDFLEELLGPTEIAPKTPGARSAVQVQEKESVRILLHYGHRFVEEDKKVWEYLLAEIDELDFHSQDYKDLLDYYRQKTDEGAEISAGNLPSDFPSHLTENLADLLSERYEISRHWEEKHEIIVPQESDNLPQTVYAHALRRKQRVIKELMKQNLEELTESVTEEDEQIALMTQMELSRINKEISDKLGTVVN